MWGSREIGVILSFLFLVKARELFDVEGRWQKTQQHVWEGAGLLISTSKHVVRKHFMVFLTLEEFWLDWTVTGCKCICCRKVIQ